jgi:hypothetical protein
MSGDLEIMHMLIAAGADPLLATAERPGVGIGENVRPSNGMTSPFMVAAGVGWRPGVSRGREADAIITLTMLLEDYGADINAANQSGDTALHGAVNRGSAAIVEFLVAHGADMNARNARDLTPYNIAQGQVELTIEPNPALAALLMDLMQDAQ